MYAGHGIVLSRAHDHSCALSPQTAKVGRYYKKGRAYRPAFIRIAVSEALRRFEDALVNQAFCNLYGVQRGAFA